MEPLRVQLKIVDSPRDIERKISTAIVSHMNLVFGLARPGIEGRVRLLVYDKIYNSEAYQSLLDGELRGHMGLRDPEKVLTPILHKWVESVIFLPNQVRLTGGRIRGGFSVSFIEASWRDVLEMPEAEYVSYNRAKKTAITIPWLKWLLEAGDQILVRNWSISLRQPGGYPYPPSRSERAIMVEGPTGFWRVPRQFSGTSEDNFVTRALQGIDNEIRLILQEETYRKLAA